MAKEEAKHPPSTASTSATTARRRRLSIVVVVDAGEVEGAVGDGRPVVGEGPLDAEGGGDALDENGSASNEDEVLGEGDEGVGGGLGRELVLLVAVGQDVVRRSPEPDGDGGGAFRGGFFVEHDAEFEAEVGNGVEFVVFARARRCLGARGQAAHDLAERRAVAAGDLFHLAEVDESEAAGFVQDEDVARVHVAVEEARFEDALAQRARQRVQEQQAAGLDGGARRLVHD
mmetsp:Transcript_26106/g.80299  ORF Transcript_26106/g.80299 Transcript_26106/m.80299 type:complete len:230 (-) Transcript_26106:343-1032(-)